jgi:hypothetical protein
MSLPRRVALLAWARRSDAWIIEDDYLSELQLKGRAAPALASLDGGRVLHISSFSKTISLALRLGFMVVPPEPSRRFSVGARAGCGRAACCGGIPARRALPPSSAPHEASLRRATGGLAVLLLARSWRCASGAASGGLCRTDAGRRLRRLWQTLRGQVARAARSSRPRAGRTAGASSLISHGSAKRRSRPRRSIASMFCSPSSARSTVLLRRSVCVCAGSVAAPDRRARGLVARAARQALQGTTIRPRQSITASAAGTHLPASLMRGACACQTMPPSASYGLSPWAEEIGPSPAPMRAAGVRLRSTPSSPPPSSTTSIHRLGLPTCLPACRIIPPGASTNSCLGIQSVAHAA